MADNKIARNDLCPCRSGKKYKHCCLLSNGSQPARKLSAALDMLEALQGATQHYQAGRLLEADAVCQQILQVSPGHPDALHMLGMIAYQIGMPDVAETFFSHALEAAPNFADGHNNLGVVFMDQGKLEEASACYQKAISLNPTLANAHYNLGNVLKNQGKMKEAVACFQKAISLKPDYAKAHNNLGDVLQQQGNLSEAVSSYLDALRINSSLAETRYNLGCAYHEQGNLEDAVSSYRQAITIKPGYAHAHNSLGKALQEQNKLEGAAISYQLALGVKPDFAEAYINLWSALLALGRLDEAVACGRQALTVTPDDISALSILGDALFANGLLEDAILTYRKILSIMPEHVAAFSSLLFAMQYMSTVTPQDIFNEHQHYAERYETPLKVHWTPHSNNRDPDRRLKIGYVSGDFLNHAVAFFIEPILANHDKSKVEIYCYYNHTKHDSHTDRIEAYADHWLVCAGMSDEKLAERIRADGIDILVDLAGHTARNRLLVFARKPAPVQATWIGYPGTTGLTAMDYRITDAYMDPPGLTERYHSEQVMRMPDTGAAYRPEPGCPPVNQLPALTSGEFMFACLNNLVKINSAVAALWARLLAVVPGSRLMLGNATDSGTRQRLVEMLDKEGIPAQRLILHPRMPIADYLALHQQIDLALDPFPYSGGTSTLHSLWMGVPVITLAGGNTASRSSIASLSRIGLNEFITHSEEEYLQRAIQFAQNPPGLNLIRQSMRERMSGERCEPGTITGHLEAAYRDMWRKWCEA